jgi:hypothetical protein
LHAALAQQQHAHLRVDAAQGTTLGQRGVDFLTHELGTKGIFLIIILTLKESNYKKGIPLSK